MKKVLTLIVAVLMIFSLVACGNNSSSDNNSPSNASQQQSSKKNNSSRTPSTDYFYEKYDFTEKWMIPDDGVYTSYKYIDPANNEAGNEAVIATIYDITEEQIQSYVNKVVEHGYEKLTDDTYTIKVDSKTAMIKINNYMDDGYIQITIDPSI